LFPSDVFICYFRIMKTVLAKFDENGICKTVWKFNYSVNTDSYPGAELIVDEELKKVICPEKYQKINGVIEKIS